ncbi:DUF2490 domain-containing protein [Aquimarina sp. 2-A2]|uniref:DUF2490 domain-containing protein n=1 Tax=Aquimarina sp. 2-A2 TaxID=3382644 RepID=UPI00387F166F
MKSIYFCVFLVLGCTMNAQITETDNTMLWTTIGLSKKLDDKFRVSYYQINSLSIAERRFNFIQPDLEINYEINKNWDAALSYTPTFSLDGVEGNQLIYHRISADIKLSTKVSKRIRMKNSFTVEHHFTQRSKFQQRYYYRLDLFYRNTKLPWRLRPFATQKLYWYANGRDLQYYDADGNKTESVSPNGLHAYRLKAGIKFYPSKKFNFSIYYQMQKEFNSNLFGSRDINSLNPNSNKIRRAFYDFSVIGISCNYKL